MRVLVIPCYNEEKRLVEAEVLNCITALNCAVVLVNDGSKDNTLTMLKTLSSRLPNQIYVHSLAVNKGKGEAVRQGVRFGFDLGATEVGFCDADFSVDAHDLHRLFDLLSSQAHLDAVVGSRVAMSGSIIERSLFRHISGRVFATLVTFTLKRQIYDTQCGAKVFRVNDVVRNAFAKPFVSRWAFDVEIIGRIFAQRPHLRNAVPVREVPLDRWIAQPGSKLSFVQQLVTVFDLVRIRRSLHSSQTSLPA